MSNVNKADGARVVSTLGKGAATRTPPASVAPATLTPPLEDPAHVYPNTPGLITESETMVYNAFRLKDSNQVPITPDERTRALKLAGTYFTKIKETYMGYQVNMKMEYEESLSQFLNMHINNIGDPFTEGTQRSHSKFMERAVLDYFASLWNAKFPHDDRSPGKPGVDEMNSYWGYCLSMGATEGNLYGMWNGRDYLAGKVLLHDKNLKPVYTNGTVEFKELHDFKVIEDVATDLRIKRSLTPICFYSKDTHYCLKKSMTVLNIRTFYEEGSSIYPGLCPKLPNRTKKSWPHTVPSNSDGSVDIESLAILAEFFVKLGYPILVNFNYGTTFKGAYDDVEAAGNKLIPILKKYGMYERKIHYHHHGKWSTTVRNGFWFNVDGALGAAYMPFIEMAYGATIIPKRGPNFDFRLPFVHSIVMSGHKWIGAPVPCGIYMSKTKYQLKPPEIPMYIGSPDTTFAGSRSGLAAMILWDFLSRNSIFELIQRAIKSEGKATYLEEKLKCVEKSLCADLYVFHAPLSLTVIFKRPVDNIVEKYSLSTVKQSAVQAGTGRKFQKSYAHAFAMEHVSIELINAFSDDLLHNGYPEELQALQKSNPKAYKEITNS